MTENHNKSSRLLFVPLNTNHVLIMNNIIKHLQIPYEVLSHDKISSSAKYHTENMLKKLNVPFRHFAYTIDRNENENFSLQIYHFFCIKKIIEKTLTDINPNKIVLAVDNDPISYIILKFSRNRNIQSFILQEASARPDANVSYPGFKGILIKLFSFLGIRLGYILHGTSHLYTEYFVSGNAAKNVMIDRGIPEKKLRITGQPKYDDIMIKAASLRHSNLESKQLLFAAGLDSIDTEAKIQFVKRLVQLSRIYGLLLLIKLHPRSNETPDKYRSILNDFSLSNCCIVKEGDDTFSLLEQSYALITVASTVVIEALILNREAILVNYLAGSEKLNFSEYNCVHTVENINSLEAIIEDSIKNKKSFESKKRLLNDHLYRLDGKAGERIANAIEM